MLIRGARILQQLEETTYLELERQTLGFTPSSTKRQHAVDPIQIKQLELVPAVPSNVLSANGLAQSADKQHSPVAVFSEVIFENDDSPTNVSFTGADGEEYNIQPISLSKNNVKVNCSCLDFRWRFAAYNHKDGSLFGNPPAPYQKKTDRPPANQQQKPGVCKHLMKLMVALKDAGVLKT